MTKTEKLEKEMYRIILGETQSFPKAMGDRWKAEKKASQILKACWEAGLVFKVKDAELPFPLVTRRTNDPRYQDGAIQQGMRLMLEAGYRKTEGIEWRGSG